MATPDDINSTLQNIARQLGLWVQAYSSRLVGGTFTLAAATTTVVSNSSVKGSSVITFSPTNSTAAQTQSVNGLFISAQTATVSFSISAWSGAALGTETFSYQIFNPT